jgi:hypothetical protein
MTLVVQWWFFVPFGKRGRVLNTLPINRPQCPFIQMTDTNVTFLSCYNIVGRARMHVMTLTSPASLPLSRPWAGLNRRRLTQSHFLISGPPLLTTERLHLSFHHRILPVHTLHDPCLLSTLISLPPLRHECCFFRVCQTLNPL